MSKKMNRQDKRRQLLGKKLNKTYTKFSKKEFAKYKVSAKEALSLKMKTQAEDAILGDAAVRHPLNKRLIAIILAIVMVVSLIPLGAVFLRPKADSEYLDNASVLYRINGVTSSDTVKIAPGVIADNVSDVEIPDLPDGAQFVKAVLVDTNGYTAEEEVYGVGAVEVNTYYSLSKTANTGTLLGSDQQIVLVYANKYKVTPGGTVGEDGTVTMTGGTYKTNANIDTDGSLYMWGGEDLEIKQLTPNKGYKVSSVRYTTANSSGPVQVKNGAATIPSSNITGDITLTVAFDQVTSYSITDASYAKGLGNGGIAETPGGTDDGTNVYITSSEYNSSSYFRKRWMPEDVAAGATKTFYLYSDSNTGGSEYILNMLRINGTEVEVSKVDSDGATASLSTGEEISVTLLSDGTERGLTWLDNKAGTNKKDRDVSGWTYNSSNSTYKVSGWRKYRTIYEVKVTNVYDNLTVEYNFKKSSTREMIIKGLRGIEETGASKEIIGKIPKAGYYFYTLVRADSNVYTAYYNQKNSIFSDPPSNNLYVYRVKDGYNPYDIDVTVYYDGVKKTENILEGNSGAGLVEDVIATAGERFNTSYRCWGENDKLVAKDTVYGSSNLLLTDIYADQRANGNTWYAIAVQQNAAKNQQMYLNVKPYNYHLQLDLCDGSLQYDAGTYTDGTSAVNNKAVINEVANHTVEDEANYLSLPSNKPTLAGQYFVGWQLISSDGGTVNDAIYQADDRIELNSELMGYSNATSDSDSDRYILLRALWKTSSAANQTTTSLDVYKQVISGGTVTVGDKNYTHPVDNEQEVQVTGLTVVLNYHNEVLGDKADYYEMRMKEGDTTYSVLKSTTKSADDTSNLPDDNKFAIYYDYKLRDLTVKNNVLGYPKTQRFQITVTLKMDDDSPITFNEAKNLIGTTLNGETETAVEITESNPLDTDNAISVAVDSTNKTLTYTLMLTRDQSVVFTDVPYGWTYTVAEEEKENDYAREISSENGALKSDTTVTVTNMVDNSELHTTKTISGPNAEGKYSLQLEAWATGEKVSKYDVDPVPTDIALVIDQSAMMATTDMNPTYKKATTPSSGWTVAAATAKQYYVEVGDKHYPVKAGEGTIYYNAGKPRVYSLVGSGHNFPSLIVNGSPTSYNIPSNYYYPDVNGVMRRVFTVNVAESLQFSTYQYVYNTDELEDYYYNYGEWNDNTVWLRLKAFGGFTCEYLATTGWHGSVKGTANSRWKSLIDNKQIEWIGGAHNCDSSDDGTGDKICKTWTYGTTNEEVYCDLYQIKDGTNYNHLYYIDDQGYVHNLTKDTVNNNGCINLESEVAYNGDLYEVSGDTRVSVVKDTVKAFLEKIAENARVNQVDHCVSIIGFAGSEVPLTPTENTLYNATPSNSSLFSDITTSYSDYYDYVNTGLFIKGSFRNYNTITSFVNEGTNYINRHYYYPTTSSSYPYNIVNNKAPITWNGQAWQFLGTSTTLSSNNPTKYRAMYTPLRDTDYLSSWQSAYDPDDVTKLSKNENTKDYDVISNSGADSEYHVNDYLEDAITKFGANGGTYTSYGVSMAKRALTLRAAEEASEENSVEHNHVVVVFTAGEPGANGYEDAIANEAIFDSNDLKDENGLDAKVYTIGLFAGDGEVASQVETFMKKMSSEYEGVKSNPVLKSELDSSKTYYYIDQDEHKTYSLTAKRNGNDSTAWWSKTLNTSTNTYVYSYYTPMTKSSENTNYTGAVQFYNESHSAVYDDAENRLDTSKTYYVKVNNNYVAVNYEPRWYNSNNAIRDPVEYDGQSEDENRVQFYSLELGDLEDSEDEDSNYNEYYGNSDKYYYRASNAEQLEEMFDQVTEGMLKSSVKLTGKNSLLKDVVTGNFDSVDEGDVEIYTVGGTYDNDTGNIVWDKAEDGITEDLKKVTDKSIVADVYADKENDKQSVIDVTGFDYSDKYIAKGHETGQKVVVIINNLDPIEIGYNLPSNTDASGLYELVYDKEEGFNKGETKLLYPFDIPEINRPQHTLSITGDDKEAKYSLTFLLQDQDGNSVTSDTDYVVRTNENGGSTSVNTVKFEGGSYTWANEVSLEEANKILNSIIFENLYENEGGDKYHQIAVSVTKSNDTPSAYTYTRKQDGTTKDFSTAGMPVVYVLKHGTDSTETTITSKLLTKNVTIKEVTKKSDTATEDYSDPFKKFDIILTLTDGSNKAVSGTYSGVTFNSDGQATIQLYNDQTQTIAIPSGYKLAVDEDDAVKSPYYDYYQVGETGSMVADELNATTINDDTTIIVTNTIDEITRTGILDGISKLNPFFVGAAVVAALAALYFAIRDKRRREQEVD